MDHFCPWVGGVVSETTMKPFLIFTFYASLFCAFLFGVTVWAIVDRKNRTSGINGNWLAIAAAAGLFGFIAIGMFGNTIRQQLLNLTTIEFLGSGERHFFIAVLVPPGTQPRDELYPIITYPLSRQRRADERRHDLAQEEAQVSSGARQFAVLQSRPGYNIWNCGRRNNLKSVLGERYIDWILPIRYPPCCSHDNCESDFPLGEDFEKLKSFYGLPSTYAGLQRKRRRRRRSSHRDRNQN
jgi:palmitoyltransferase